jgi:ATP-dependent protease Clp ATPase subunit
MLKKLRCSFCNKDESKVAKLVAGPGVYICDECVSIANQIMKDSSSDASPLAQVKTSIWRRLVSRAFNRWYFTLRFLSVRT